MQAGKAAVFGRLLEVEGIAVDAGQPWPLHVHMVACILQRVFCQWPQASLCRYSIQRPEWLDSVRMERSAFALGYALHAARQAQAEDHRRCFLWLQWCTAWGLGGIRDISLFAVNVYDDAFAPMHVRTQLQWPPLTVIDCRSTLARTCRLQTVRELGNNDESPAAGAWRRAPGRPRAP
jgi:hypothetical protein